MKRCDGMIALWFAVFSIFSLGIILAFYHLLPVVIILMVLLLALVWIKPVYAGRLLAAALVLGFSWLYYDLTVPPRPETLPTLPSQALTGTIENYPKFDGRTASFILRAEDQDPYLRKIQVFCFFDPNLRKGDRITLQGELKPPAPPGNPGELDYPFYLRGNGIYYTLSIKEAGMVKGVDHPRGPSAWLVNYQMQARELFKNTLSEDNANILLGMLLGAVEGIDPEEYRDYQKTGIIHVFSVSGMHIGFLLLAAVWLTSLLEMKRSSQLVTGLILLLVYGGLTGWPSPVLRSSIMGALGLLAYYSGRENSMLNSLGLAGLAILLLNPLALLQMSFQFTFLATWGLVGLFPLVRARLGYKCRLWDLILIPLCAQLPMFPLLIYHFNLCSPVSLLSNILLGYLSGIVVVLGFAALVLAGWLPFLTGLFLNPAGLLIELIRGINSFLVDLPGAFLWVAAPHVWTMAFYYAGLALMVYALARKMNRRWIGSGGLLMLVLAVTVFIPAGFYDRGTLKEVFIDVGQGDSVLIKTPQGKFIMVDGGGSEFSDIVQRKLMPYLHHEGIRDIWLMVSTHPDTDHLQGLETVLGELSVRQAAVPASLSVAPKYNKMKQLLADKGVPLYKLAAGDELNVEAGLGIKVLHPGQSPQPDNSNGQSLVLELRYGNFSSLLTGDIDADGLRRLMSKGLEPVTAVKIPHHGSKGSLLPGLYDEADPQWAVISVGANNRFGHPSPLVLEELERQNIEVYRTDLNGAITIRSDGETSSIESFR